MDCFFWIGVALLAALIIGLLVINFVIDYPRYDSGGAVVDTMVHTVLFLPPAALFFVLALILRINAQKQPK